VELEHRVDFGVNGLLRVPRCEIETPRILAQSILLTYRQMTLGTNMGKKIYIAGCGGMLGEAFYQRFKDTSVLRCTDIDVNESWLEYLDFRDYETYRQDVRAFTPDYLFHLGAYTDLEYCELHPGETYLTNTLAVENACHIASELNVPLLYVSTAGIFDGKKTEYDDWDQPNPLGHYARSKYAGEVFVRENVRQHLICRAGWMMGGGPKKDKKFVQKILRQIKDGVKELHVVHDKLGTPTYTHDFAKNVELLIGTEMWGLYNMVCEGETSRLEVAREILLILGLNGSVTIQDVPSEYFRKEYFAERPASERLINRKLNLRNLNIMRDWKVSLAEYLGEYYKEYLK
jgi:dTDP-4-dehydrorhamnose reductase